MSLLPLITFRAKVRKCGKRRAIRSSERCHKFVYDAMHKCIYVKSVLPHMLKATNECPFLVWPMCVYACEWMQIFKQPCMHMDNILWPWDLSALLFLWLAQLLFHSLSPRYILHFNPNRLSANRRNEYNNSNENKTKKNRWNKLIKLLWIW